MNTQRITISLPKYLYEILVQHVPAGKISRFAAEALEKELTEIGKDPFEEFISLRESLPKSKGSEILNAIRKGRV